MIAWVGLVLLLPFPGMAYELSIKSAVTSAGLSVDLPINLKSAGTPVAALVFEVEYDASRLEFEMASGKGGLSSPLSNSDYTTTAFRDPASAGRIGISAYDPQAPVLNLPEGPLVILRFQVRQNANGFAYVRIVPFPTPDAANAEGVKISEWNPSEEQTGVFVSAARAELSASPQSLSFGSVASGRASQREVLVSNIGTTNSTINTIRLEPYTALFALATELNLPLILAPGASVSVPLMFRNDAVGKYVSTLVVEQSQPAFARLEVPLSAVIIEEGAFTYESKFLIPAVARRNEPGSRWRSTLALFNPGEDLISVVLTLIAADGNSTTQEVRLTPGESRLFIDAIAGIFGDVETRGALLIHCSSPDLVIVSSLLQENEQGGTLGQAVPALAWSDLFHSGDTAYLAGLEHTTTQHSDVALLNLSNEPVTLQLQVIRDRGIIGEQSYTLQPWATISGRDELDKLGQEASNLVVTVRALSPAATFFVYGSTVDMRTGGPIYQAAR